MKRQCGNYFAGVNRYAREVAVPPSNIGVLIFPFAMTKLAIAALIAAATLSGCGAIAAPCRFASATIKIVPIVGHAAALPTDACAAIIDP